MYIILGWWNTPLKNIGSKTNSTEQSKHICEFKKRSANTQLVDCGFRKTISNQINEMQPLFDGKIHTINSPDDDYRWQHHVFVVNVFLIFFHSSCKQGEKLSATMSLLVFWCIEINILVQLVSMVKITKRALWCFTTSFPSCDIFQVTMNNNSGIYIPSLIDILGNTYVKWDFICILTVFIDTILCTTV